MKNLGSWKCEFYRRRARTVTVLGVLRDTRARVSQLRGPGTTFSSLTVARDHLLRCSNRGIDSPRAAAPESGPSVRIMTTRRQHVMPLQNPELVQARKQRHRCHAKKIIGSALPHVKHLSLRGRRARGNVAPRCPAMRAASAGASKRCGLVWRRCSYDDCLIRARRHLRFCD